MYVKTVLTHAHPEHTAYEHLSTVQSSHPGRLSTRQLLDSFRLFQDDGSRHYCLVHSPLHTTMFDLQRYGGQARPFPEELVKESLRSLLEALDFLHVEAGIVHCDRYFPALAEKEKLIIKYPDLKLSNVMLQIKDTSVLAEFADSEQSHPIPRKVVDATRTIYGSRKLRHPRTHAFGPLVLCDFGEARIGSSFGYAEIQPAVYKAPEILLQLDWNHMVDIWNLACVVSSRDASLSCHDD